MRKTGKKQTAYKKLNTGQCILYFFNKQKEHLIAPKLHSIILDIPKNKKKQAFKKNCFFLFIFIQYLLSGLFLFKTFSFQKRFNRRFVSAEIYIKHHRIVSRTFRKNIVSELLTCFGTENISFFKRLISIGI